MIRGVWLVGLMLLAGCGSGSDSASTTSSSIPPSSRVTHADPTTTADKCLTVDAPLKAALGIGAGAAIMGPHGIGNADKAWFVTDDAGAIWVTAVDPSDGQDNSGLTLPLNAKARSTSALGAGVKDGSPVYKGYTESSAAGIGRCRR